MAYLPADWLDDKNTACDPWVLRQTNPQDDRLHDALIGNGRIGLRFPSEGEGSCYQAARDMPPTGCFMQGLWSDHMLLPPPQWHNLSLRFNGQKFTRDEGKHEDYHQDLDLKTATLTTTSRWITDSGTVNVIYKSWLSLAQRDCLVIELTLQSEVDGTVKVSDLLKGFNRKLPNFGHHAGARWGVDEGEGSGIISLRARMGARLRQVAVASQTSITIGGEPVAFTEQFCSSLDDIRDAAFVERELSFSVTAGESYQVTKIAALQNDRPAEL